ncbi:MAG: von Willebrand factor type A domain-containing protein [Pirellulales bacterium]|nr:von Willebrand factor type A domain-containing protein [Pirellulales bacterium]
MRRSDPEFEARQDAELRAVALPEGLLRRLRQIALADDAGLDEAVRHVRLPAGLTDRLRRSLLVDDEALDAAIRGIPTPVGVAGRLRRVPKNWIRLARLTEWATAASLLIAIGASYLGAMIAFLWTTYPPADVARPNLASSTVQFLGPSDSSAAVLATTILPDDEALIGGTATGTRVPLLELDPVQFGGSRTAPLAAVNRLFDPSRIGTAADPWLDTTLYRWGVFGAHAPFDDESELKKVAAFVPRGVRAPMVPGYPRAFESKYGVHPFVSPESYSELRISVVPLGIDASSYELTRRYLEDGELPPRDKLRTEEFLAAVDYEFPRPKDKAMGLHIAGGPAPFTPGVVLMQVGVQAREIRDDRRPPIHLTLAVDTSASMRWGGRLAMIRRALTELGGRLGPEDRISLVEFSEDAELTVDTAGAENLDYLMAGVAALRPKTSTNVGAGLSLAYAVAGRPVGRRETARHVVLLTDGLAELSRGETDRIEARLAEAADGGVTLNVLDLAPEKEFGLPDPQLAGFSQAGGGGVHRAASADQIGWVLREIITGKSQRVAAEARLEVSFNPKVVLAYRLIGHEPNVTTARPEADFYSGQSATAVYEVQLKPGATGEVATAEVTWRDAQGDHHDRASRKIHSNQFSPMLLDAPLSLQAAAVVVETAKVLRRSPFTPEWPKPASLARVLKLAEELDPQLAQRPTFVEFISMVKQAEKVKSY